MQSIGQVLLDKIRHNFVKYQVTKFSWDSTETVGGGGGRGWGVDWWCTCTEVYINFELDIILRIRYTV